MLDKAIAVKRRILDGYFPNHISDELDAEIRAKFDIQLPRAAMKAQRKSG